jgi:HPt (histidine-containing phosphotransfer) domain-containing protein
MTVYLEDAPCQIEVLKEALQKRDPETLQRQAHTLKGASANVGALRIQETALRMEEAGGKGDLEKAAHLLKGVEKEFEDFKAALSSSGA